MLGGVERHRDTGHEADVARPHAGAIHHDLARHLAAGRRHAGHPPVLDANPGDGGVLEDRRAATARALGQSERGIDRVGTAVAGQPQGADQVVSAHERPAAARLGRRDDCDVDVEAARHRGQALELVHALRVAREAQAARPAEARGLTRFGLELLVEIAAVLGQPRQVLGRPQLADEPGGVPGRTAGDVATLQQQDVAPAELRQVIRDAAAGDTAADDDHPRVRREGDSRVLRRRVSGWSAAEILGRRTAPARPREAPSRAPASWAPSDSRARPGTA